MRRMGLEPGFNLRTVGTYAKQKPRAACDFSPNCTTEVIAGSPCEKPASKTRKAQAKTALRRG